MIPPGTYEAFGLTWEVLPDARTSRALKVEGVRLSSEDLPAIERHGHWPREAIEAAHRFYEKNRPRVRRGPMYDCPKCGKRYERSKPEWTLCLDCEVKEPMVVGLEPAQLDLVWDFTG